MFDAVAAGDSEAAARIATAHRAGNLAAWRAIIEGATETEP
jgi:DNA-binding GntR family transcriptional regulator